jgi:hypothetical protein
MSLKLRQYRYPQTNACGRVERTERAVFGAFTGQAPAHLSVVQRLPKQGSRPRTWTIMGSDLVDRRPGCGDPRASQAGRPAASVKVVERSPARRWPARPVRTDSLERPLGHRRATRSRQTLRRPGRCPLGRLLSR